MSGESDGGLQFATQADVRRIESKVDDVLSALNRLVLFEERQATQKQDIAKLEERLEAALNKVEAVKAKLDAWVNRGVGAWALVAILWSIYQAWAKTTGKGP